jgi:hypothetical protein
VQIEIWDETIHIFPYFASAFPEGVAAIEQATPFLRRTLGSA